MHTDRYALLSREGGRITHFELFYLTDMFVSEIYQSYARFLPFKIINLFSLSIVEAGIFIGCFPTDGISLHNKHALSDNQQHTHLPSWVYKAGHPLSVILPAVLMCAERSVNVTVVLRHTGLVYFSPKLVFSARALAIRQTSFLSPAQISLLR